MNLRINEQIAAFVDGIERCFARPFSEDVDDLRRFHLNIGDFWIRDEDGGCVLLQANQFAFVNLEPDRRIKRRNELRIHGRKDGKRRRRCRKDEKPKNRCQERT